MDNKTKEKTKEGKEENKKFNLDKFLRDSIKAGEILEKKEREEKEREYAEV